MSTKKQYFAKECLLPPPYQYTYEKGYMDDYNTDNGMYYRSKHKWCTDCKEVYQDTCMKDYQNLYHINNPVEEVKFEKQFYDDYSNMLTKIDNEIKMKPDITKEELMDAMKKSYAAENFIDTCISLRLNHHRNCIRRKEDLNKPINQIHQDYLEGDEGHKGHIDVLRNLRKKASNIYLDAKNHPTSGGEVKVAKKKRKSRAKSKKSLRSPKTTRLRKEKDAAKKKN